MPESTGREEPAKAQVGPWAAGSEAALLARPPKGRPTRES